jgi:NAD(P)-dependent dehydrogenase (short-subunit alcohol dehydrogenase family)
MRRVVLVTGAGGRLGDEIGRRLLGSCDVVVTFRTRRPRLPTQLDQPIAFGASETSSSTAFAVQADLTEPHDVRRLAEVVLARFGRIDVLINCAADVNFHGSLRNLWPSYASVQRQLHINSIAPVLLSSIFFDLFWKDRPEENAKTNRSILNISSVSGLQVAEDVGQGFYGASKAALNFLTMHLAGELAPYGVRVNALCPSRIGSDAGLEAFLADVAQLTDGDETGSVRR